MKNFTELILTPLLLAVAAFAFMNLLVNDGHIWFAIPIAALGFIAALLTLANVATMAKNSQITSHKKGACDEK